jgi:hypothetical protein
MMDLAAFRFEIEHLQQFEPMCDRGVVVRGAILVIKNDVLQKL